MSIKSLVSIVIPTKNGEATIARCLESIANQTHKNVEVIVIDSGSTDATLPIAAEFPFVRVLNIPPQEFNHGTTRNLGVQEAKGDFVLMTVQDAHAYSTNWIEIMLNHFRVDSDVVGVCGQQVVPHELDKNPHEWFRPFSTPVPKVVHFTDPMGLKALNLQDLHQFCGWDNVNALYRREALLSYPFACLSFGEDMAWAKEVVTAGKKIVYDYNSRVYHYHHSTYDYTYKRTLTVLYHTYKNFGYVRKINYQLQDYLKIIYRNIKYKVNPAWIVFNWQKMMAASRAYRDIMKNLKRSEATLDSFHFQHCGLPPQGKQSK